ncbi:MAG: Hpt domain-containing protein [Gammaproteobacteria bacterium]|nr:Hpt domain-containing protein [Gammaproteobacteria bacterium]
MAISSTVDLSTLGWVKTEIEETLKQARQALESYLESPDEGQLRFCSTHLHQVIGTLEMVELDGAAMLARELEAFVEALLDESVGAEENNFEILIRGILSIPDYLSRLEFGQPDVPIRLLPVINDLRRARATDLLNEVDFFSPDLSVRPPYSEQAGDLPSEDDYGNMAKRLRPKFQASLLAWLRDTGSRDAVDTMVEVLDELSAKSRLGVIQQLFWVASGLLEAMMEGELEPNNERKKLLSKLDQQMKKLVEGGGRTELRDTSESLVKTILYELGGASNNLPRVGQLRKAFDLDLLLGKVAVEGEDGIDQLPTPEVLESVAAALKTEIDTAQEHLSVYFDPDHEGERSLVVLIALLDKMSATIEMLGVPLLKKLIDALGDVCRGVEIGEIETTDDASMVMARGLLLIENSARDISHSATDWKRHVEEGIVLLENLAGHETSLPGVEGFEVSDGELTESDFRQLLSVVAEEIRANLSQVEEEFEAFANDRGATSHLAVMQDSLGQIYGALQIIGEEVAGMLVDRTMAALRNISRGVVEVDNAVMDALAIAIGTIGAYIDGLLYNRSNLDALLDLAFQELHSAFASQYRYERNPPALIEALEDTVIAWRDNYNSRIMNELKQVSEAALKVSDSLGISDASELAQHLVEALDAAANADEQSIESDSALVSELAARFIESAREQFPDDAVEATIPLPEPGHAASAPVIVEEPAREAVSPAPVSAAAAMADVDDDFDEEIMEIFIEDARDSVNTIVSNFPGWRDSEDNAAMLEVRRGFHTIKGSGRMVGVTDIAELAWAFENMLNRVRDGKMSRNAVMVDLIQQVMEVMPVMIDALESGTSPAVDHESLRLAAEAVAEGRITDAEPAIPVSEPIVTEPAQVEVSYEPDEPEIQPVAKADDEPVVSLDGTLLNIFVTETRGHLQSIRNHVGACQKRGSCFADADMVRVAHTVAGSGRSVGLTDMSTAAKEMEKLFLAAQEHGFLLTSEPIALYSELEQSVGALVDVLLAKQGSCSEGDMASFIDLAARIADAETRLGNAPVQPAPEPDVVPVAEPEQQPVAAEPVQAVAPEQEDLSLFTEEFGAILAAGITTPAADDGGDVAPQPVVDDVVSEQIDEDLADIFYEEAVDILQNLNEAIATWRGDQSNTGVIGDMKRALHTFKGGARMAGAMTLGELAHKTETMLGKVESGDIPAARPVLSLLEEMHDTSAAACEQLNAGQPMTGLKTLEARLDAMIAGQAPTALSTPAVAHVVAPSAVTTVAEQVKAPAAQAVQPEPVSTRPAVVPADVTLPADNIDTDLADIFYEEAVDLLSIVNDSLVKWRTDTGNTSPLTDLKRAMHTFKGGARMAGAMSIGQVAHLTETAVERAESGTLTADTGLIDLLDEVHDTFVSAIEQVNSGQAISGLEAIAGRLDAAIRSGKAGATATTKPIDPGALIEQRMAAAQRAIEEKAAQRQVKAGTRVSESPLTEPADSAELVSQPVVPAAPAPMPVAQPDLTQLASADPMVLRDEVFTEKGKGLEKTERREQIRVRTDLLDTLANYAGEVSISRARMEQQVYGLRENLGELQSNVHRFRDQLRELEIQSESQMAARIEAAGAENMEDFDPLEFDRFTALQQLSRSLTESFHDLTSIQNSLGNFASEAETVLVQQARINTDLQEGLMRTRMVALSTQATRLRHIVRQTSRELGKSAQLVINNTEVELDRNVLERMIGPFEHMIRNAIDHGLEPAEKRKAAGKPELGTIRIDPVQQGNEVVIRVSDDGRGLDIAAIRKKAVERGLMSESSTLSDQEVTQFILMAGFSTATAVTHISGRGVGMDVVHNEVRQLGGSMSVDTKAGEGTTFIIALPLTLSIMQALMVKAGEQLYAVPLSAVINLVELPAKDIKGLSVGDNPLLNYRDQVFPFMHLGERLGVSSANNRGKKVPILLARSGPREVAIEVDGLGGTREIVIKGVGRQVGEVQGIGGATILGDGSVVLILDIPGLWLHEEGLHVAEKAHATVSRTSAPAADVVPEAADIADDVITAPTSVPSVTPEPRPSTEKRPPIVMVVDDSLTVRKITSRHLHKRGMEVHTAKDGLDAVEQLREIVPDVMLVDIEMPRMDGYELTSRIRAESGLKHIPIIMITSRAGAKHKEKALSLGVDIYMSKPYQEDTLLANIEQMLNYRHEDNVS